MNSPKTALPTPSFSPAAPAAALGAAVATLAPRFDRKPNPMSGKIRSLVERHPDEAIDVLRRWLNEKDDR